MVFHEDESITGLFVEPHAARGVIDISDSASGTASMSDAEDDAPFTPTEPDAESIPDTFLDTQVLPCDSAQGPHKDTVAPDTCDTLCGWFADTVAPDTFDSQLTLNQEGCYYHGVWQPSSAAPMAVITTEPGSHDTMDCSDEDVEDVKLDPKFIASVRYVLHQLRNETSWSLC